MSERPPLIPQDLPGPSSLTWLHAQEGLSEITQPSSLALRAHPHFRDPFSQLLAHLPILSSSPSSKPSSPCSHMPLPSPALLSLAHSPSLSHSSSPSSSLLSPFPTLSLFSFSLPGGRKELGSHLPSSKGLLGRWGAQAGSPRLPAPTCTPPTTRHALDTRAGADTDTRASDGTHMQTHTPATRDTGNSAHAATHQAHTQADRR